MFRAVAAGKNLKPYQGLKLRSAGDRLPNPPAGKNLKPYQGLKPYRGNNRQRSGSLCRKKPKTLSGIETLRC